MRVALGLVVAIVLAGCSTSEGPGDDGALDGAEPDILEAPDWAIAALRNGEGHDHYHAPDHAGRTTPNFRELGHDALETERADGPSGGYLCGDVGTDHDGRDLVVTQSHVDDVVLVVADVTDPDAPVMLGELVVNGLSTYDAAVTDDAAFALVAVSGGSADTLLDPGGGDLVDVRSSMRGACGVHHGPFVRVLPVPSVLLVDLRDPTSPTIVDQAVVPGIGVHSVSTTRIDGTDYVVASSTGLLPALLTNFVFFTVELDEAVGPTLRPYGYYDGGNVQSRSAGYASTNLHTDATIAKHPLTVQILAYLANWSGGMVIVELVAPGAVVWQSEWGAASSGIVETGSLGESFSVHSTLPLPDAWEDRHVTVVGEETINPRAGMPSGLVILVDTTDPSAPQEVARWTLPSDAGGWDEPLIYSPHYMTVVDHTVFVSMYHGGVWAFDAAPQHWPYPPTVGMFLPAKPNPDAPEPGTSSWAVLDYAPSIAEVLAKADGTLISFDSHGGVHTYRYEPSDRVEPVENWFATH